MKSPEILPSWRDGAARTAIVEFARSVAEPGESFVPPEERIATFDNDGTLWCEKPTYVQAYFVFRRWQEMVRENPELAGEQPYKALAEGDRAWLSDVYAHVPELIEGVTEAFVALLVRHDDAEREFAYDRGAERALAAAKERGWTVVSMKGDFATIF